ncbi:MAG TPA: hypothetical protein VN903_08085 [Polyangia bacterium]|jgi:hypothetical protein|nr:hypothetical protein [Polyangia bacterium]
MPESTWRILVAATLVLGACGGGTSNQPAGTGGGAGSAMAGASGGTSGPGGMGGGLGAGGSNSGTGGAATPGDAGRGGTSSAGTGGSSIAGTSGQAGAGGGGAGAGGASNAGTSGSAGRGGGGGTAGGPGSSGRGGSAGGGGSGTGGASACTRDLLRNTITAYFTALAAHSASTLPLASNVKFTENGKVMTVGQGLWATAGAVKYAQSALDVETCSSATHAVVPDGNMDIPVALRLKLQNQMITEIETIAVRPGDYKLSGQTFASNPAAIISANNTIMWETPPAAAQRNTRAELIAWMDKYFRMFPRGVCNTVSSCRRLENGYGNFVCTDGGTSCAAGMPTGTPVMDPRILIADPDNGIAVGMTMFMGNTDMHMIKMYGGQVYAVHAVLGGATSSGW